MSHLYSLLLLLALVHYGSTCAPLTGGPFNFRDLQNNLNVHPIDSNSLSDGFVTSTQLDCSEPLDGCAWRNEQSTNQLNWYVASFKAPNDPNVKSTFTRLTGSRLDLPNGKFFAIANENPSSPPKKGVLRAQVPCQNGQGSLGLKYWSSSERVHLTACINLRPSQSNNFASATAAPTNCKVFDRYNPSVQTFTFNPPANTPFDIILEASGFSEPDFIAVDDIVYTGEICSGTTSAGRPVFGSKRCEDISCDFEQRSSCLWNVRGETAIAGQWNVNGGRIGNPYGGPRDEPGTPDSNTYAYVGREKGSDPNSVYVMESPKMTLRSEATLTFDLFQRHIPPIFKVCLDNVNGICPYIRPPIDNFNKGQKWLRSQTVKIPAGDHKILFVAQRLGNGQYFAVDNIRLSPATQDSCQITGFF